ncbi:MurR/RpiR family transcriptional regulator [Rhizobium sp. GCM10022189]|uniref:MurR/RpiR family transcriptional regulator n=1 Tax=Rhizobium sp. GCM10022189 TaxID=3252654 RepID=UPI00360FE61B
MNASDRSSSVLREHFEEHRTKLSRSELAVAEHLVRMPIDVLIFRSAEEIAAETGTSDATVIRTAKRLGFSGLPELKRVSGRVMARTISTSERLEQRFRATGDDLEKVAGQMFATAREVLTSTEEQVDGAMLAAAISFVEGADTVWCIGLGTAEVEARHCAIALSRAGVRTRCTGASGFTLANELIDLRPADVIVMFHAVRETAAFKLVVRQVRDIGCKVILVCGVQLRARYADEVSAVLTCIGSPSKLASWSIGAIVMADLLAYGVAVRNQQQATDAKKRLAELRDQALGND